MRDKALALARGDTVPTDETGVSQNGAEFAQMLKCQRRQREGALLLLKQGKLPDFGQSCFYIGGDFSGAVTACFSTNGSYSVLNFGIWCAGSNHGGQAAPSG